MDTLKAQFERIQQQLSGLSASRKMLTGCLVAIMVGTLWWWANFAGTSEMVPVLNQSFSENEVSQITLQLAAKQIPYKVSGDKILIPTDRKFEVLADLGYHRLLPNDTRTGFDDIVKQMSAFDPQPKTEMFMNRQKELMLAQIIRRFPRVQNADVMIDPTRTRSIGKNIDPTATINISLRSGEKADKHLVTSAADVVAGAQAGLNRGKIRVVIDGVSYPVHDDASTPFGAPGDALELVQQHERRYAQKISDQLSFIPGVMVSVTVEANIKTVSEQEQIYDPKNVIHKEIESRTQSNETTQSSSAGGEAGAMPNTSMAAPMPGVSGSSSVETTEETKFIVQPSVTVRKTETPAGDAVVAGATVRVPRSYFVSIYRGKNPSATSEIDDALIQPLIDVELAKIKGDVKMCTGITGDEKIVVGTYWDALPTLSATGSGATAEAGSLPISLSANVKEIAVGVLAVVSLFMMLMMVRKGGVAPALPMPAPAAAPQALPGGENIAGEASEGGPALDGMELDDDVIRTQQMIDQVSTMVKENPDAAAGLVKRWLNK